MYTIKDLNILQEGGSYFNQTTMNSVKKQAELYYMFSHTKNGGYQYRGSTYDVSQAVRFLNTQAGASSEFFLKLTSVSPPKPARKLRMRFIVSLFLFIGGSFLLISYQDSISKAFNGIINNQNQDQSLTSNQDFERCKQLIGFDLQFKGSKEVSRAYEILSGTSDQDEIANSLCAKQKQTSPSDQNLISNKQSDLNKLPHQTRI